MVGWLYNLYASWRVLDFPGTNHQLQCMMGSLGAPPPKLLTQISGGKLSMTDATVLVEGCDPSCEEKYALPLHHPQLAEENFVTITSLLKKYLNFDPTERTNAKEALADPYFASLTPPLNHLDLPLG
ncbi:hypothetical protein FRB95_013613 [Tulasnella sp. JGI-2019a]|nr:hypothetical protein FRB95_013613 [Tulasnella sp. JGI-2019a]